MSAVRASALPALVIPPRRSDSPLECSDGVSPHQLAKAGAERNLLKDPASAASLKAVRVSTVSVNLFFTSFAKQARRSRKGGFTGCANVFSPIPVTA